LEVTSIGFLTRFAIRALELVSKLCIPNMLTKVQLVGSQGKRRAILELAGSICTLKGKGWLAFGTTILQD
jgi:hypothetical protein